MSKCRNCGCYCSDTAYFCSYTCQYYYNSHDCKPMNEGNTMSDNTDKLTKDEREAIECLRAGSKGPWNGCLFGGSADLSGNARKGILDMVDRLAPKPIQLVSFEDALTDMAKTGAKYRCAVADVAGVYYVGAPSGQLWIQYASCSEVCRAPISVLMAYKWYKVG